ncbi:MAG TPA: hypothetical protein VGA70_07650 [Longimicrobiales bacterium]
MPEIDVRARISDEHYRAYEAEAKRRGVPVKTLIEQTVNCLLEELEQEEKDCREAVIPS